MHPLAKYRAEKGLTQAELAEKLGVSQGFIAHLETGARKISFKKAQKWESLLDGEVTRADLRPDIYGERPETETAA